MVGSLIYLNLSFKTSYLLKIKNIANNIPGITKGTMWSGSTPLRYFWVLFASRISYCSVTFVQNKKKGIV
jgi:hypothetical protein